MLTMRCRRSERAWAPSLVKEGKWSVGQERVEERQEQLEQLKQTGVVDEQSHDTKCSRGEKVFISWDPSIWSLDLPLAAAVPARPPALCVRSAQTLHFTADPASSFVHLHARGLRSTASSSDILQLN